MFLTVQKRSLNYLNIIFPKFKQKQTNKKWSQSTVQKRKQAAPTPNTASLKIL